MKYKLILIKSLIVFNTISFAQSSGEKQIKFSSNFITANVITNDNNVYHGIVKLGNNDLLWTNLFQAKFISNKHIENVPEEILKTRKNYSERSVKWIVGIPFRDTTLKDFQPVFSCDYAALNSIEKKNNYLIVKLQNQEILKLKDRAGDLGYDVYVYNDLSTDPIKIKWCDIKKVEFKKELNANIKELGIPLYGKVKSKESSYTGIINWDQQEKHNNEFLNGKNREGRYKIPFKEVSKISKDGDKAVIEIKSGNKINVSSGWVELFTDFSNDIGSENQGIIVTVESVGKIKYSWKHFYETYFSELPADKSENLKTTIYPEKLIGEIITKNGKTYSGILVYNLFKERNIEYLYGYDIEGLLYAIPFQNIKSVTPKNDQFTLVQLKNDQKLLLGNSNDVNNSNDGLLIYNSDKPSYISWNDIETIQFIN